VGTTKPQRASRRWNLHGGDVGISQSLDLVMVVLEQPPCSPWRSLTVWAHHLDDGADELVAELVLSAVGEQAELFGRLDVARTTLRSGCASRSMERMPSPRSHSRMACSQRRAFVFACRQHGG
jgi:hypothetical protein